MPPLHVDAMVYLIRLRSLRAYICAGYYAQASAQFDKFAACSDNEIAVLPRRVDDMVKVNLLMADIMLGLDHYAESLKYIGLAIDIVASYTKQQLLVINRLINDGDMGCLNVLPQACKWLISQILAAGI